MTTILRFSRCKLGTTDCILQISRILQSMICSFFKRIYLSFPVHSQSIKEMLAHCKELLEYQNWDVALALRIKEQLHTMIYLMRSECLCSSINDAANYHR